MVVTVWTSFSVFWVFFSADFIALDDVETEEHAKIQMSTNIFIPFVQQDHSYLICGFHGFKFFPFSWAFVVIIPKKAQKQVSVMLASLLIYQMKTYFLALAYADKLRSTSTSKGLFFWNFLSFLFLFFLPVSSTTSSSCSSSSDIYGFLEENRHTTSST